MSSYIYSFCQSNVLEKYQLKSLKLILIGGTKINRRMIKEFNKYLPHVAIRELYGFTEAALYITRQTENSKHVNSSGFVFPGVEIKIRDLETNEILGSGKLGELCVKSSTLTKGYFKDEKATKAVTDAEGWYHSGDVAYYNEDGEVFIIDRIVDAIIYKNHRIWPNQIENILRSHDDVIDAMVVANSNGKDGVVVFVEKDSESNVTEKELMKSLESFAGNEKFDGIIKFIDKLPRNVAGKVVRKNLVELIRTFA